MLKEDHKSVERLFKRFEKAGDRAFAEKRKVADRVIEELSAHAAVEEQLFYPVARATVPGTEDNVLESLEEHHIVKWVLAELDEMDPTDERFDAKMTVLAENVRHHVEEEEQEFFPKVRKELDRRALNELGEAMAAAKMAAPTHPHPRSPDTPPGNAVAGMTSGVVDRISDTVSGVAQGSVTAVQDLVARILGRKRRAPAPTGSSVARSTAGKVRSGAASATDDAIAAVVRAKETAVTAGKGTRRTAEAVVDTATDTAQSARDGAKRTASTARTSAKRTAKTASGTKPAGRKSAAGRAKPAGKKRAASTTRRPATPAAQPAA